MTKHVTNDSLCAVHKFKLCTYLLTYPFNQNDKQNLYFQTFLSLNNR